MKWRDWLAQRMLGSLKINLQFLEMNSPRFSRSPLVCEALGKVANVEDLTKLESV